MTGFLACNAPWPNVSVGVNVLNLQIPHKEALKMILLLQIQFFTIGERKDWSLCDQITVALLYFLYLLHPHIAAHES